MRCSAHSSCSLTPNTTVASRSLLPGCEKSTFFAPAAIWASPSWRLPYTPVQSSTTSTDSSFQGSASIARSCRRRMASSPTKSCSRSWRTSQAKRPWLVSYFNKCAMPAASASSLIATTVISARRPDSYKARTTLRPMRPKPLIATRTVIGLLQGCPDAKWQQSNAAKRFGKPHPPQTVTDWLNVEQFID